MDKDAMIGFMDGLDEDEERFIFYSLREKHPIHELERLWNVRAEVILEAIHRSSDLTKRGVKGIIAEASFKYDVLEKLGHLKELEFTGDNGYDFLVDDKGLQIKIQVKLQRSEKKSPMIKNDMFVVETQKTRGGIDKKTSEKTRPYRYGDFDILAVSMFPSTGRWDVFAYTVSKWLIPDKDNPDRIRTLQPVPFKPNDDWTDDLSTCIKWFKSGKIKTVRA
ncbi:MAG: hypothetical protein HZA22_10130 [Nitrospirae bacterium]|nr:hypothetical protein [Nitrospirota bacterium]